MAPAWKVEPLSTRITEDVKALPRVHNDIIAAEGCVVKNVFPRTGRRSRRFDDKGTVDGPSAWLYSAYCVACASNRPYHRNVASVFQFEETHFSLRIPPRQ